MVSEEDLEKADKWFARYGDWAAFVSRLLPIVRTFISFPAGVTKMNFWRFIVLASSARSSGAACWPGRLLPGRNWETLRGIMRPFDIPIAIVIVAAVAYYVYRHVQKREAASGKWQIANGS